MRAALKKELPNTLVSISVNQRRIGKHVSSSMERIDILAFMKMRKKPALIMLAQYSSTRVKKPLTKLGVDLQLI